MTEQGQNATQHAAVMSPVAPECPASSPAGVRIPSGNGGKGDDSSVLFYMDDAVLIEAITKSGSSSRCLQASAGLASDHFRLCGELSPGQPRLLASRTVSLGFAIGSLDVGSGHCSHTISVPPATLARTRNLPRQQPASRNHAREVRSLTGMLLHICEVVRPGKFFRGPHA